MSDSQPRAGDAVNPISFGMVRLLIKNILFACFTLLVLFSSYRTPSLMAETMGAYKMNPYEIYTPQADKLKFPPSAGVGVYWGDGRFTVTLNNFYDEELKKCILQRALCFRQEGDLVYATGKEGWLVLNLATGNYHVNSGIESFEAQDQVALKKLIKKSKGNIYFNPNTLMPKI